MNKLIVEAPINTLSLGNVSLNILKALYKKKIDVLYLPIGQPDVGNYKTDEDFRNWLQNAGNRFFTEFKRDIPSLKIWHLNQSWHFPSDKKYLLTFHETDAPTQPELNIIKNIDKTFFCGNYSSKIFNDLGVKTGEFNLGFDSDSFYKTGKRYFDDGRIQWFLGGKLEARKNTLQILNLWAKKYGKKQGEFYRPDEQKHFLNICVFNPFYDAKVQEQQLNQALEGQKYVNIQAFPFLGREQFNDLLNASDIDLTGLSSAESWNLPAFNMTCLGKWSIVLNATGHKTWANEKNCILVQPNGKKNCVDNVFFHQGAPFNQGNFYTFDNQEVINAMESATKLAKTENLEGEKLKEEFTYDKTVDNILKEVF
jgi:hypothetical protein